MFCCFYVCTDQLNRHGLSNPKKVSTLIIIPTMGTPPNSQAASPAEIFDDGALSEDEDGSVDLGSQDTEGSDDSDEDSDDDSEDEHSCSLDSFLVHSDDDDDDDSMDLSPSHESDKENSSNIAIIPVTAPHLPPPRSAGTSRLQAVIEKYEVLAGLDINNDDNNNNNRRRASRRAAV